MKGAMHMKKIIIGMIIGLMIFVLCAGCSPTTNDNSSNALIVEDGMIKYSNNGKLEEVIALEDLLTGKDNTSVIGSKEIELFVEDGYIVWNYIGETSVHKLIAIEDLVGKQGETGAKGATGATGATGAQGPVGATGATGPQGAAGADGSSAYIWVKYLDNDPGQSTDEDLSDTCSNYMGIYYGTLASAPNDIDCYQWYEIKGEKGDKGDQGIQGEQGIQGVQGIQGEKGETGAKGEAGTNAFAWIRYLENAPENSNDSDLSENPNNYMGVYSGSSATAPTEISSYQWFKIKGEQGEKGDKGDQGEKGDTGETGATGPQGPQGSIDGSYLETYYDNLAVVSFSVYSLSASNTTPPTKSCTIEHEGQNIDVEVDDNCSGITIRTDGDYIIELDGVVSFTSANSVGATQFQVGANPESAVYKTVTVDNNDGYGHFYSVKSQHLGSGNTIPIYFGFQSIGADAINLETFSFEFSIKIHKK